MPKLFVSKFVQFKTGPIYRIFQRHVTLHLSGNSFNPLSIRTDDNQTTIPKIQACSRGIVEYFILYCCVAYALSNLLLDKDCGFADAVCCEQCLLEDIHEEVSADERWQISFEVARAGTSRLVHRHGIPQGE